MGECVGTRVTCHALWHVAGKPIAANYTGGGPPAEGGIVVSFSDPDIEAIANNIASDELHQCAHAHNPAARIHACA